ncbi:branched-chain-amino-acid aminotransferase 5, chloroplastic-like protein [Corchorus olitorius]|uniref:Branched-chain-amino-acid aminotransferase 5, chloroplastic-like protein n=1 Tax=Corchorus olitorius TaxID=93759 RepID=A0A1R3KF92_9ROSI|nr:branched-chain-amino-acid aminotransferase 5, chloroplastic-like protein [Corchorus olitorius]
MPASAPPTSLFHSDFQQQVGTLLEGRDNTISTPVLEGTIQPGITRKGIMSIAHSQGFRGTTILCFLD